MSSKHLALLTAVLLGVGCANAESQEAPELTLHLQQALASGEVLGSAGLSWPDGRQTVVSYVQIGRFVYRCGDHFDAEFRPMANLCLMLPSVDSL